MHENWLDHYPEGVPRTIDLDPAATLAGLINDSCRAYAERDAFSSLDTRLSFAEVEALSTAFAAYLQQVIGMTPGERIALMMPNCLQYVVALSGALRAGLAVVNVNPLYTARELEHQLTDAGVKTLLVMENSAATVEKIRERVPVATILTTQLGDMLDPVRRVLTNFVVKKVRKRVPEWRLPGAIDFRDAIAEGQRQRFTPPHLSGADPAFLQYTGGTGGPAKGVLLTHANILANVAQCRAWFAPAMRDQREAAENEIIITALPMYHIYALTVNTLVYFAMGGHNILIADPRDSSAFVKTLARHRFSVITGVNSLFNGLLNTPGFAELDFSGLRLCMAGGMPTQKSVAQRWHAATGRPIIEGYGLSETSPVVTCNRLDSSCFNHSVGYPLPSTAVDIRDDAGTSVALGAVGELCVRGPQVMAGYWQRPEADAEGFTADGFFKTGDLARQDEQGLFYIVDRKKDMILVSGFNVYPSEIEDVVAAHEGVLEAAAVGVPDEKSGEAVKLFVVKKRPDLTMEEIRRYCREHLTGYKNPKHFEFINEVPKSNVGKILRRQLR